MRVAASDIYAALNTLELGKLWAGAVSVSYGNDVVIEWASGLAQRAYGVAATSRTRFAMASGSKGFTALVIASLIEEGRLAFDTPARHFLGADLPLIPSDVTVEHLLTHTSGIGDYIDEALDPAPDYWLTVPVQNLVTTEQYLAVLDGLPAVCRAGERFAYNNSGFVVLALLAKRASAQSFHDLVRERVLDPAGMSRTSYPRSDMLPGDAAIGYLPDGRTNVFHLPVVGSGDGGAYTTLADMRRFWGALLSGRILPLAAVADLVRPRRAVTLNSNYGAGFWVRPRGAVELRGCDAGVSFSSVHDPASGLTHTVAATTDDGAWPVSRCLAALLEPVP